MSRKDNLVVQELDGEVLIYDLAKDKAFCLNETSALVWQACDGNKSTAEISEIISNELNSPANEDLVWFALEQLKKEKLIDNADQLPSNFAGMSRREVVKKVGLGTMIALPIVASMVAPVATHAQSLVGPGGTFTTAKTLSNCGGPYILGLCQTAAMTICASGATSGATNCSNPDNFVTCTCA